MAKVQLVALKTFRYGGRLLHPGTPFETPGQTDALRLRAFKMAELRPPFAISLPIPEPEPQKRSYVRRDFVKVEEVADPAIAPIAAPTPAAATAEPDADEQRPKRAYRRRDLTAET